MKMKEEPIPSLATFRQQLPEIGDRIRQARQNLGMTQTELAARIGLSSKSISALEVGRVEASASQLLSLSAALKEPVGYFMGEPANVVSFKIAEAAAELAQIRKLLHQFKAKK